VFRINPPVRVFKSLVTDIQNVYRDANKDFVRSLVRFDKSLQDAGLLLLKRVDENVIVLLSGREGMFLFRDCLTDESADKRLDILNWLSPERFSDAYDTFQSTRVKGSGTWFLNSSKFQDWVTGTSNLFIVSGNRNILPSASMLTV